MSRDTRNLQNPLNIGDEAGGNYTGIDTDGTLIKRGDATMWDDLTGSLIARRLFSTTGRLQYNYAENSITMQDNGTLGASADTLIFNFQKPHGAKDSSEMRLHIHWEQNSSDVIVFSGRYRIQNNGSAKTTAWTTFSGQSDTDSLFSYTSGTLNQITKLIDLDLSSAGLSATIQFQLARTDSTGSDIDATFIDAHIEYEADGSTDEYSK